MLVVVGSTRDPAARDIVSLWAPHEAALLACEDLSVPGWQHRVFDRAASRAVVGGRIVHEQGIRGVLVRRPWILTHELAHIAASDREYVAAEMSAFLVSWLAHLSCRVLNRPSGTSLCGSNWRPEQWTHAAAQAGIEVCAPSRLVPARRGRRPRAAAASGTPLVVTVVADRCLGAPDDACESSVRRLAAAAGVGLLEVRLTVEKKGGRRFAGANPMPSLRDPAVAQAVRDHLLS